MRISITTDYYPEDSTFCIVLNKEDGDFDLFWIDNPANPERLKMNAKKIESAVNSMTAEFDEKLDVAYELCDYLSRNQKVSIPPVYRCRG